MGSDTDFPVPSELLALLRCPETRQTLAPADQELLTQLAARREGRTLHDRAGRRVDEEIAAALVREDGKVAYPVRQGIAVLLVDAGIPVE